MNFNKFQHKQKGAEQSKHKSKVKIQKEVEEEN